MVDSVAYITIGLASGIQGTNPTPVVFELEDNVVVLK